MLGVLGVFCTPVAVGQDQPILLVSPHVKEAKLHRGQLHCHSSGSDGKQTPRALARAYRDAGYAFVAISDHLALSRVPRVRGITSIPASEIHDRAAEVGDTWGGHHINGLGLRTAPRKWDRSSVRAILARIGNESGLAMANHPRIRNPWSTELLLTAKPLHLVSIFNGRGYWLANRKLPGSGGLLFSSVQHWDRVLTAGRMLWGVAADDCHDARDRAQFDQGWVLVGAATTRAPDLLTALRNGDLYACRGPKGKAPGLRVTSDRDPQGRWTVTATSDPGVHLTWIASGRVVARGRGQLEHTVAGEEGYLRAEARSPKNPDARAYSQPIQVVRGPRVLLKREPDRLILSFQDRARRPVILRQSLRIAVTGGKAQLPGTDWSKALLLPAGESEYLLQLRGENPTLTPEPSSGWPAVTGGR